MRIVDLAKMLEEMFPLRLQEKYDNAGPQILFREEAVVSVLISLDLDKGVVAEAVDRGCNLIITHHPPLFKPLKSMDSADPRSELIFSLINNRISLYAVHTNLDKVYYSRLGEALCLREGRLLYETDVLDENTPVGFGFLAELPEPQPLRLLMKRIKEGLATDYLIYSGDPEVLVKRMAIINGAGSSFIERIASAGMADCVLTGDVGYHQGRMAQDYSLAVIDAGHFGTEKVLMPFLKQQLAGKLRKADGGKEISLHLAEEERSPFRLFRD